MRSYAAAALQPPTSRLAPGLLLTRPGPVTGQAATGWRVNTPMLDLALKLFDPQTCPDALRRGVSFLPDRVNKPEPAQTEMAALVQRSFEAEGAAAARQKFTAEELQEFYAWRQVRGLRPHPRLRTATATPPWSPPPPSSPPPP